MTCKCLEFREFQECLKYFIMLNALTSNIFYYLAYFEHFYFRISLHLIFMLYISLCRDYNFGTSGVTYIICVTETEICYKIFYSLSFPPNSIPINFFDSFLFISIFYISSAKKNEKQKDSEKFVSDRRRLIT